MRDQPPTPDKLPDETNWQYCVRAVDAIPAEWLVTALLRYIERDPARRRKKTPVWSIVGEATNNGSGFSSAIVRKYLGKDVDP